MSSRQQPITTTQMARNAGFELSQVNQGIVHVRHPAPVGETSSHGGVHRRTADRRQFCGLQVPSVRIHRSNNAIAVPKGRFYNQRPHPSFKVSIYESAGEFYLHRPLSRGIDTHLWYDNGHARERDMRADDATRKFLSDGGFTIIISGDGTGRCMANITAFIRRQ